MKDRVKFYSTTDISIGYYLNRVEEILTKYSDENTLIPSFIDAIELGNALKFIENQIYSKEWTRDFIDIKKIVKSKVNKFFNTASNEDILEYMSSLRKGSQYLDDFFEVFSRYKYAKKIHEIQFFKVFYQIDISIRHILKNDYFINSYPESIKESFLSKTKHLEILLDNFSDKRSITYFLPKNISSEEWNDLLRDYIHDKNSNTNYLRLLQHPIKSMGNNYFTLTAEDRYAVQKRLNEFERDFVDSENSFNVILRVYPNRKLFEEENKEFQKEMNVSPARLIGTSIVQSIIRSAEEVDTKKEVFYMTTFVDYEEIKDNHEPKRVLDIIMNDRDIFSESKEVLLPSFPKKEAMSIENMLIFATIDSYPVTAYFSFKNQLACLKILTYQSILQEFELSLERIVSWYFLNFIDESYNIKWLNIQFSPDNDVIYNKTATIFRIEESIRKQYALFIQKGYIDRGLYNLTQTPTIDSLPSTIPRKYAYPTDNENMKEIMFLLFHDQSYINYIDEDRNALSFIDLISSYKVSIEDFPDIYQSNIKLLLSYKIIHLSEGQLIVKNITMIKLLRKLYWYGEVSYFNLNEEEKSQLDKLYELGWISFESSLFSVSEKSYLNYLLNNSKYDNSLAIRNKYQHGCPNYDSDEKYRDDYACSLLVLLIYVVKTNEEFQYIKNGIKQDANLESS